MQVQTLSGGFTDAAVQASRAFRAVLNAMARPGTIEQISGATAPAPMSAATATVALTLCDPETPIFLAPSHDTPAIREWIAFHIGAPIVGPDRAAFVIGTWDAVSPLSAYSIGTAEYPDQTATLIVEMDHLANTGAILRGPGILDQAKLNLPDVAAAQQNAHLYPLGLDFIFAHSDHIAALPRSTKIEAE